jgi:Predicted periplasmic protein (DUF2092)
MSTEALNIRDLNECQILRIGGKPCDFAIQQTQFSEEDRVTVPGERLDQIFRSLPEVVWRFAGCSSRGAGLAEREMHKTLPVERSKNDAWPFRICPVANVALSSAAAASAEDDAAPMLKAMSEYVGSQKSISATFDSDIEVITPDLQKIQFTSSGQLQLARPDKMRVRRTGGYADVRTAGSSRSVTDLELRFDGLGSVSRGKS